MSILHDLIKLKSDLYYDRLKFNVRYLVRNGGHRIPILMNEFDCKSTISICHHQNKIWRILCGDEHNILEQVGHQSIPVSKKWTDLHYHDNKLYLLSFNGLLNIEKLNCNELTTETKYAISFHYEDSPAMWSFYCQEQYIVLFVRYHNKAVISIHNTVTGSNLGTVLNLGIKSVSMYNITDQWLYCKLDHVRCKINITDPTKITVLLADCQYRKIFIQDKVYESHGQHQCLNKTINSTIIHMTDNTDVELCFMTKCYLYNTQLNNNLITFIHQDQGRYKLINVKLDNNTIINHKKIIITDNDNVEHSVDEHVLMQSEYYKALIRWPNTKNITIPCSTTMTIALIALIQGDVLETINDEDIVELTLVCDRLDFNQHIDRLYDEIYLRCFDNIDVVIHLISLVDLVPEFEPMILDWFKYYLNKIHHEHFKQLVSDHSCLMLRAIQNDVINYKWKTIPNYRLDNGNIRNI